LAVKRVRAISTIIKTCSAATRNSLPNDKFL
jgi:hypothetical protein